MDKFEKLIRRVVSNGNCSGCAGCVAISGRVVMEVSAEGHMVPSVSSVASNTDVAEEVRLLRAACPGISVTARKSEGAQHHPTFGAYLEVWAAHATDPVVRHRGSSGGVLTALNLWMLASGRVTQILSSKADVDERSRTTPVVLTDPRNVLETAGSRYAPAGTGKLFRKLDAEEFALTGKPCEVSAHLALSAADASLCNGASPVRLSFFCAGTPPQSATDSLVRKLGKDPRKLLSLTYRGNGWPGNFTATDSEGTSVMSYEDSWGGHLGRELPWRCKICVDGTGESADISVGDYWSTDERGYPNFAEGDGISIMIVRTELGRQIVREAVDARVLRVGPASLADLIKVQPLQVQRRAEIVGRLLGRIASGKRIPLYFGFHLFREHANRPWRLIRGARGTWRRSTMEWFRGTRSSRKHS